MINNYVQSLMILMLLKWFNYKLLINSNNLQIHVFVGALNLVILSSSGPQLFLRHGPVYVRQ